jgi:hypothetical protein
VESRLFLFSERAAMRKLLIFLVLELIVLLLAGAACGQTVSPILQELKGSPTHPAKGEFLITNNSVQPLNVTLETRSLIPGDIHPSFVPLTPGTDVRLSESSFRIPAKGSRIVWFEVRCSNCGIAIYSSMVTGRTVQGLQVALHIPEVIYVCDRSKGCRDFILKNILHIADKK